MKESSRDLIWRYDAAVFLVELGKPQSHLGCLMSKLRV
jgi:hypothetical protein